MHFEQKDLKDLFDAIRRDDQKLALANWDGAAQVYLALAALYNALGDADRGQLRDALKLTAKQLQFPKGYDSPRGFEPRLSGDVREQAPR